MECFERFEDGLVVVGHQHGDNEQVDHLDVLQMLLLVDGPPGGVYLADLPEFLVKECLDEEVNGGSSEPSLGQHGLVVRSIETAS